MAGTWKLRRAVRVHGHVGVPLTTRVSEAWVRPAGEARSLPTRAARLAFPHPPPSPSLRTPGSCSTSPRHEAAPRTPLPTAHSPPACPCPTLCTICCPAMKFRTTCIRLPAAWGVRLPRAGPWSPDAPNSPLERRDRASRSIRFTGVVGGGGTRVFEASRHGVDNVLPPPLSHCPC